MRKKGEQQMVGVWIALQDVNEEKNGCLKFYTPRLAQISFKVFFF
jgi:hypothetical protein